MPSRLVVLGSGGHAKVVVEAALAGSPGRDIVILDDGEHAAGRSILGISVSGARDRLRSLHDSRVIVAIGDNRARANLMAWLAEQGQALETIVHPRAVIADSVQLGEGVFVSAGAAIVAEARVDAGAIINTGATVDHDCVIGESAHIGPGSHLCGNVRIGARALIGVGAAIAPGVSVCEDAIVGAGAVVVRDIITASIFAGNPARPLR